MDEQVVAARRLVETARPYLRRGDMDALAEKLCEEWSPECLGPLLSSEHRQVAQTAAACVGLIGDMSMAASVAELLHHEDECVVAAAEDALWSIWFRAGGPAAQTVLTGIARAIQTGDRDTVVPKLSALIRAHPSYAEAYHQRSQAYYLQNSYYLALRDARKAHALNPLHFGALANQAHALVGLGRPREALRVYRQVLRLHPTMPGIREALGHLQRQFVAVEV